MSLPFTISDVHGGISEATGTLQLTKEFLILEVHMSIFGLIKRKPLTVKVAPEAIHSIRFRRGVFRDTLYIRPWKAALLAAVPGKHDGEVELKVKRAFRHEAESLTAQIQDWVDWEEAPGQ